MDLIKETGAGLSTSNSYANSDDGDLYHESRLFVSTWTAATDDSKEAALVWATKLLDKLVDWDGEIVSSAQALRWPRTGVYNSEGYVVSTAVVPQDIVDATCELARLLIESDRTADAGARSLKSFKAGSLSIEFDKYDRPSILPKSIWLLIRAYGSKAGASTKTLVRM